MTEQTFTERHIERITIASAQMNEDGDYLHVLTTDNSGFALEIAHLDRDPRVGLSYDLELTNGTAIAGLRDVDGDWLVRYSDQYLHERWKQRVADSAAMQRARIEADWDNLMARTMALPQERRELILHRLSDDDFAYGHMGWHYVLVTEEYIVMLQKYGMDSEEAEEFMFKEGLSGNQVGWAKSYVRAHG